MRHMDSGRTRKEEYLIVFFAAIGIACCFTLIRHFAKIWSAIDSVDIAAYWSGVQLFLSDKNPYDPHTMILKQRELLSQRTDLMVWNPPILFVLLTPFYSIPFYWARLIWTALTTALSILGAYFSWRIATFKSAIKYPIWLPLGLFFCPYFYEMFVEQISFFLNFFLIASILLFKRKRYGIAGAVAGLLIVKPHVYFLVLVWYFLVSMLRKRWSFYFGFFSSIAIGSILAELLHPGISMAWLTRESWPMQNIGSTLPSLVRAALYSWFNINTQIPQIIIPLVAIFAVAFAIFRDYRKFSFDRSLILAIILCPLCSSYGFVFDQALLIIPIMIIASHAYDQGTSGGKRRGILIALAASQILVILTAGAQIFGMKLGWYLLPPLILIIWIMAGCPAKTSWQDRIRSEI
jgi:hypothetical protein